MKGRPKENRIVEFYDVDSGIEAQAVDPEDVARFELLVCERY